MAIAFDAQNSGFSAGAQASLTVATTVTGSNTFGVVLASSDGNTVKEITGVTWNGVAMTNINNAGNASSNSNTSLWYIIAPATGNVVISVSPNRQLYGIAQSYTGAKQSAQPDASNTANDSTSPFTISTTTVADKSWIAIGARGGGSSLTAGTNVTERSAPFASIKTGDTNADVTPAGATSQTWTDTVDGETVLLTCSIAPFVASTTSFIRRRTMTGIG